MGRRLHARGGRGGDGQRHAHRQGATRVGRRHDDRHAGHRPGQHRRRVSGSTGPGRHAGHLRLLRGVRQPPARSGRDHGLEDRKESVPRKLTIYERFKRGHHDYNGISAKWAAEQMKILRELETHSGVSIELAEPEAVKDYLAERLDLGDHPNTVRKKRAMIVGFYGWAFDAGVVDAEHLMRMRRVKNPRGSTGVSVPRPYSRPEMRDFWREFDKTWPAEGDGFLHWFWLRKHCNPFRAASHGMRLQVRAIVCLALHAGLRASEIYKAPLSDIHYDNEYVVVRFSAAKNKQGRAGAREVPM